MVATTSQPALGAIRLAWWRDALEDLDRAKPSAEPRLQSASAHLLPFGVTGALLAGLEESHAAYLDEVADPLRILIGGERIFAIASTLLNESDPMLPVAGRLFALARARRRGIDVGPAGELIRGISGHRFPKKLRPITAFASLSVRDITRSRVEADATPGRALTLLRHRLTGQLSR